MIFQNTFRKFISRIVCGPLLYKTVSCSVWGTPLVVEPPGEGGHLFKNADSWAPAPD